MPSPKFLHALVLKQGEDAEAVMLHLMQPAGSGGWAIGERKLAGANEVDLWISPPAGRNALRCDFHRIIAAGATLATRPIAGRTSRRQY